jgi:hypothetical protein
MREEGKYKVSTAIHRGGLRAFPAAAPGCIDAVVLDGSTLGESSAPLADHLKNLRLPLIMISGHPTKMEAAEKGNLQLPLEAVHTVRTARCEDRALARARSANGRQESQLPPVSKVYPERSLPTGGTLREGAAARR